MPTEPGRLARSACYGPRGHRPRRLWLARSRRCRRDGGCRWSNGLVRRIDNPWHPCRAPQYRPARHGHGRRDIATPWRAPNIRRCWAAHRREDVSHQPLQPNSCHEHPGEPTLPSAELAPCRPPLPGPPLFADCFAGAGTILSVHGGAERPRGPSDLEWRRAWHRSRQLEPVINLPPSGPWPETVSFCAAILTLGFVGLARGG